MLGSHSIGATHIWDRSTISRFRPRHSWDASNTIRLRSNQRILIFKRRHNLPYNARGLIQKNHRQLKSANLGFGMEFGLSKGLI